MSEIINLLLIVIRNLNMTPISNGIHLQKKFQNNTQLWGKSSNIISRVYVVPIIQPTQPGS